MKGQPSQGGHPELLGEEPSSDLTGDASVTSNSGTAAAGVSTLGFSVVFWVPEGSLDNYSPE